MQHVPGHADELLLVSMELNASGTEVLAMSLPSSHLALELLMLLQNSADPLPRSLPPQMTLH